MTVVDVVMLVVGLLALAAAVVLAVLAQGKVARAYAERDTYRAQAEQERRAALDKISYAESQRAELLKEFERLSSAALQRNNEAFLQQASERLGQVQQQAAQDLSYRHQQAEQALKPFDEKLNQFHEQVQQLEKERATAFTRLYEQMEQLRRHNEELRGETRQLAKALRAPQQRGKWGELQLRRIVEFAGMLDRVDFTEQFTTNGDDGRFRPDLVVHLGEGKQLVVDAKVSLQALLDAFETDDEDVRAERFAAHARHLRQHVDQLAGKRYWNQLEITPEFVVMFVPSEPAMSIALDQDPGLYEHAFASHVLLCTPASLVALLRTVSYIWRQEALARNAAQVLNVGRELYDRLKTMGGHVGKLGNDLNRAIESYNRTVGSLESRVLVTARRMSELGVTDEELADLDPIERAPRYPQAPELLDADNGGFGGEESAPKSGEQTRHTQNDHPARSA